MMSVVSIASEWKSSNVPRAKPTGCYDNRAEPTSSFLPLIAVLWRWHFQLQDCGRIAGLLRTARTISAGTTRTSTQHPANTSDQFGRGHQHNDHNGKLLPIHRFRSEFRSGRSAVLPAMPESSYRQTKKWATSSCWFHAESPSAWKHTAHTGRRRP